MGERGHPRGDHAGRGCVAAGAPADVLPDREPAACAGSGSRRSARTASARGVGRRRSSSSCTMWLTWLAATCAVRGWLAAGAGDGRSAPGRSGTASRRRTLATLVALGLRLAPRQEAGCRLGGCPRGGGRVGPDRAQAEQSGGCHHRADLPTHSARVPDRAQHGCTSSASVQRRIHILRTAARAFVRVDSMYPRWPRSAGTAVGADRLRPRSILLRTLGGSSNGRTSGFGPENRGSNPCPPARLQRRSACHVARRDPGEWSALRRANSICR